MPKTIRELADELKVSKQTIQYHYQRLPAKNRQKDNQGTNMISLTAERIIRDKVAKPLVAKTQQTGSKKVTKTSKENNELIATLRREVTDLKSQRNKQIATKDRQIAHLIRLIDQQQQLQLTTLEENRELKAHIQKISGLLETSGPFQKRQNSTSEEDVYKNKSNKNWWRFW
ncbi:replication protein RepB [Lactiplantibacillus plantarum]|nr:replication protein RepB [Lactiplantibacillus plantarum]